MTTWVRLMVIFTLAAVTSLGHTLDPMFCGIPVDLDYSDYQIPPVRNDSVNLRQVHVFMRHGARTVYNNDPCWPNEPEFNDCNLYSYGFPGTEHGARSPRVFRKRYLKGQNAHPGSCMTGQLTEQGLKQTIRIGKILRKAYVDSGFLPNRYHPELVFVRADDASRTIDSVEGVVQGLYPPRLGPEVVDVFTMDYNLDDMLPNPKLCPKLGEQDKIFEQTSLYKDFRKYELDPLLQEFSHLVNQSLDANSEWSVEDCLTVNYCHRNPIPTSDEFHRRLRKAIGRHLSLRVNFPSWEQYARVAVGPVLQATTRVLHDDFRAERNPKMHLILGHDTGPIIPLANILGFYDGTWPAFASTIALEFYEDTVGSKLVRAIYNGKVQKIQGCQDDLCSFEVVNEIFNQVRPRPDECLIRPYL